VVLDAVDPGEPNTVTAALLAAAADQKPIVDDTHAKKAIAELTRN